MATLFAVEPQPAGGADQARRFEGILARSRDLIGERLDQAVATMLDKGKDALSARILETRSLQERRLYEETRGVITEQRPLLEKQFRAAWLAEFRKRCDRARRTGTLAGEPEEALLKLELVGEDDYEETLKFNAMSAKLRAYCDEELVALDQRVGVLLGDANLQANDNPFSPQVICDAFKHSCRQADADARVRRVLLKLFDDHVLDDVRSMYKAVNGLLVENAILPKIRYSVARAKDRPAAGAGVPAAGADPAQSAQPEPGGGAQDFFSVLQGLMATSAAAAGRPAAGAPAWLPVMTIPPAGPGAMMPAGGYAAPAGAAGMNVPAGMPAGVFGAAGAVVPGGAPLPLQGAELMTSLTRVQHGDLSAVEGGMPGAPSGMTDTVNVLRELRATSVGARMGEMDIMTLDIVAMMFDQLFDDPKVPNGVKGLIGRMQIPTLKVAIADKSFFSTKSHPARRLLDTLGEIAARLPAGFGPADSLFARVRDILQELVEGFQADLAIFTTVREKLEGLLAEEDRRIDEEARAAAKRVEEMENLAVAKRFAAEAVKARVDAHRLPRPVLDFLVEQWLKVLLLLNVKEGNESAAYRRGVAAMDELIWSIEPRPTREERRRVVALIPGLVKQLAVGLKTAGIEDSVRKRFFGQLMQLHRRAITAPPEEDSAPGAEARQPAAAEGAPDFSAPVTVKNPFGEGNVDVASLDLDFTTLEGGGAPAPRDAGGGDNAAALSVGTWVAFRASGAAGARRTGRLIFVTPRRTRYLFAFDRAGKDIDPYTPGELDRHFRLGEAAVVEEPAEDSLFDRIMQGLVGRLRAAA
ncbi:MAG: DUF1631 domain-containing protein [Burkholderiales bacterium]|nr:DUF1631 domain-containing protein [Burkholderiales bacterium]